MAPKKFYVIGSNLFFGVITYCLYTTYSIYESNIQGRCVRDKHTSLLWPKKGLYHNLFYGMICYCLYATSSIYISNIQVWEGTQAYNGPKKVLCHWSQASLDLLPLFPVLEALLKITMSTVVRILSKAKQFKVSKMSKNGKKLLSKYILNDARHGLPLEISLG
jgi:hypothetical protein